MRGIGRGGSIRGRWGLVAELQPESTNARQHASITELER
jgi:hypothetical protein